MRTALCGTLRSEWWQFLTDVSAQTIGSISNGYVASSGNFLPTFRHNLLVPYSMVTQPVALIYYRRFDITYWPHTQWLSSQKLQFLTDVSVQPFGPILSGYAVRSCNFLPTFQHKLSVPYSVVTQSEAAISYRRFSITYGAHFQVSTLKVVPICCPETSVRNYP